MHTTPTSILAAQHISLSYPTGGHQQPILEDVSLQLQPGETLAILGFSGSGKSSLLRVLAGLNAPQQGQVLVHGKKASGPHPQIGFMFQDPCLLPWLTLEGNVALGLRLKNQRRVPKHERSTRIKAMLEEVGLCHAAHSYPAALSGGMAQRASLARSLVRQPDVLLLDEPFSALDAITRAEMQELLLQVTKRHGTAAVLVTHDIDEALTVANRIVLLGGSPSYVVGQWQLTAQPNDVLRTRIHEDIVRTLREQKNIPRRNTQSELLAVPA